jgi:gamma-glutamylcyclotransferase (GGCT)/AIG2-like uncharacterized protein YtfP
MREKMNTANNVRYLAVYGSNLNIAELKRKWGVNLGQPIAKVLLPDRRLAFTSYSNSRRGGVLDIPAAHGSCVEALIFRCSPEQFAIICRKEGSRYVAKQGWAYNLGGERLWVTHFEVKPEYRQQFVAPGAYYLSVVRWGYEHFGLSTRALEAAAKGNEHSNPTLPLFVYGTLKRGQSRHEVLAPYIKRLGVACEMWGKLKSTGSYPMLTEHMKSRSLVSGEGYSISQPEEAFRVLDKVEGALSHTDTRPGFYRTPVLVATKDKGWERLVWCYVWWGDLPAGAKTVKGKSDLDATRMSIGYGESVH